MNHMSRIFVLAGALLCAALLLAGCGDREPAERRAFIAFLQAEVLPLPGVRFPLATEALDRQLGRYAAHYAVIPSFHAELEAELAEPMRKAAELAGLQTLEDVQTRTHDIIAARDVFVLISETVDRIRRTHDARRAELQQPDDLAPVFAAAYDKIVTTPADTMLRVLPDILQLYSTLIAIGEFLDTHADRLSIRGRMVHVDDPALRSELDQLMNAFNRQRSAYLEATQAIRSLMWSPARPQARERS